MADVLIGRAGDSLSGRVLTDPIGFRSSFGEVELRKEDIAHIHVMLDYAGGVDQVVLRSSDSLKGTLLSDPIQFKMVSGTEVEVPRKLIHTIHMGQLFRSDAPKLDDLLNRG